MLAKMVWDVSTKGRCVRMCNILTHEAVQSQRKQGEKLDGMALPFIL
jgi:hypothetical protein